MFSRSLLITLTAFVATVLAKTTNMDPQYALLTISNEYQLFVLETQLNSTAPAQLGAFNTMKSKVHTEIVSGKADLTKVTKAIDQILDDIEKLAPGYKAAAIKLVNNNKLDVYGINKLTPEASWDFLYSAFKRTLTELKADKSMTSLEKLNDDFEALFKAGGAVDTKAMIDKINAFTTEAKDGASLNFEEMYITAGDLEIEKYNNKVTKIRNGETLPVETTTEAPATSSGSAAKETEKPQAAANSTGSSTGESASATVTAAPAATTAAAAATKTPAPSSSAVSTTLSVAASVVTMAVAYLVL